MCAVPMEHRSWHYRGHVLAPDPSVAFAARAVKDPSLVYHDGTWHLFYTAISHQGTCSLGYVRTALLADCAVQQQQQLSLDDAARPAAPYVFYHSTQQVWYLIFQVPSPRRRSYIP